MRALDRELWRLLGAPSFGPRRNQVDLRLGDLRSFATSLSAVLAVWRLVGHLVASLRVVLGMGSLKASLQVMEFHLSYHRLVHHVLEHWLVFEDV